MSRRSARLRPPVDAPISECTLEDVMKYILMMNTQKGPYQHESWPEKDWNAHLAYWRTLNAQLEASGELVSIEALTAPDQAKRVHAGKDGKPITDGVFPE